MHIDIVVGTEYGGKGVSTENNMSTTPRMSEKGGEHGAYEGEYEGYFKQRLCLRHQRHFNVQVFIDIDAVVGRLQLSWSNGADEIFLPHVRDALKGGCRKVAENAVRWAETAQAIFVVAERFFFEPQLVRVM